MDVNDLEAALNNAKKDSTGESVETAKALGGHDSGEPEAVSMTEEEEKGFHKGALNTLAAERNELAKMVGNVEAIMQAHINRLKELGVDIQ